MSFTALVAILATSTENAVNELPVQNDCSLIIYLWHLVYEILWTEFEDLSTCIIHAMVGQKPGGVGGTPLYSLYRYVRPQRVWFFSRFGHK